MSLSPRIQREQHTVNLMIALYCKAHHAPTQGSLCEACTELQAYALRRTLACKFGDQKPACSQCPVHCYRAAQRQQIRQVMRYAGPRMIIHHPLYALLHVYDKLNWNLFRKKKLNKKQ